MSASAKPTAPTPPTPGRKVAVGSPSPRAQRPQQATRPLPRRRAHPGAPPKAPRCRRWGYGQGALVPGSPVPRRVVAPVRHPVQHGDLDGDGPDDCLLRAAGVMVAGRPETSPEPRDDRRACSRWTGCSTWAAEAGKHPNARDRSRLAGLNLPLLLTTRGEPGGSPHSVLPVVCHQVRHLSAWCGSQDCGVAGDRGL